MKSHIARDCCKVHRVIESCKTYEQTIMACNMSAMFCRTYPKSEEGHSTYIKSHDNLMYFLNTEKLQVNI